jgi:hypothetical protein
VEPWYKLALPRVEVREGRSFNPNEFAIALEQVVAGRGPEDYQDPQKFFARTYFTRALSEHAGMVLRRLAGQRANTAPDLTLITQFGDGKTHTFDGALPRCRARSGPGRHRGREPPAARRRSQRAPSRSGQRVSGNAWDPRTVGKHRGSTWPGSWRGPRACGFSGRPPAIGEPGLAEVLRLAKKADPDFMIAETLAEMTPRTPRGRALPGRSGRSRPRRVGHPRLGRPRAHDLGCGDGERRRSGARSGHRSLHRLGARGRIGFGKC